MKNVYSVSFFFFLKKKKDIIKFKKKLWLSFKFLKALSSKIVIIYMCVWAPGGKGGLKNLSIILANMYSSRSSNHI